MFKTDKESLEKLSFKFDARDIANLRAIIDYTRTEKISSVSDTEAKRLLDGLDYISQLQLNGKVYAFHTVDEYSMGPHEGIELFLRQGDSLKDLYVHQCRGLVNSNEQVISFLKEKDISKIYTGFIDDEFLGLPAVADEEDKFTYTNLQEYEIDQFQKNNVEVISLEKLM